jgi:hypothetical protein
MGFRRLLRATLHLLLIAGLVLPGIAAPAQSVTQALAEASATPDAIRMRTSPCGDMSMPMHDQTPHASHGCDLAACLGPGCLSTLPHLAAFIPEADSLIAWDQPVPPSRLPDTPLRPPIA